VAATFFGDGAVNAGAVHEAMNLAAIWKLPVIFVCENNLYADATPVEYAVAGRSIAERAAAYGMPGVSVDGQEVFAVQEAAARPYTGLVPVRGRPLSSAGPIDTMATIKGTILFDIGRRKKKRRLARGTA